MKIVRARTAGFCFGVRRALELADKALGKYKKISTLGPLIHNHHVVEAMRERGIDVINDLSEARGMPVVIRSHGAVPEVFEKAKAENIVLIDATCPFVQRVQMRAKELIQAGYQVVIIGEFNHPEVKGILGWAEGKAVVIHDLSEVEQLRYCEKMGVLAQTTQPRERFCAIASELIGKAQEVRVYDTICKASLARQQEAAEIARRVDAMIVVGGKTAPIPVNLQKFAAVIFPLIILKMLKN